MQLICDLIVTTNDKRHFEWTVFVEADSFAEGTRLVEQGVKDKWAGTANVTEINMQRGVADITRDSEPREIARYVPLFDRIKARLIGQERPV
jgi:hypothetical protein